MGWNSFKSDRDIPDLSGKVILVTGGTAGIGKESLIALAKHSPEHLYFTGRNAKSAAAVVEQVKSAAPAAKVTFLGCDFQDLATVDAAARKFNSLSPRLDVLMCNAGIMAVPPALTKDGYEIQFGVNYVGHALLVKLLLPTMLKTTELPNSDVRIILSSSLGFKNAPSGGIVFDRLHDPCAGTLARHSSYGQSKLAAILFAAELSRRYPNITSTSIHPGIVGTDLVATQPLYLRAIIRIAAGGRYMTAEEGALNQIWAATSDRKGITNGAFYEPVGRPGTQSQYSKDTGLARKLWDWTEKELAGYAA